MEIINLSFSKIAGLCEKGLWVGGIAGITLTLLDQKEDAGELSQNEEEQEMKNRKPHWLEHWRGWRARRRALGLAERSSCSCKLDLQLQSCAPIMGCAGGSPQAPPPAPAAGAGGPESVAPVAAQGTNAMSLEGLPSDWDMTAMKKAKVVVGSAGGRQGTAHVAYVDRPDLVAGMQGLFDKTYRKVYTRDRGGAPFPDRFVVQRVQRVQNDQVWREYATHREKVRSLQASPPTDPALIAGEAGGSTNESETRESSHDLS